MLDRLWTISDALTRRFPEGKSPFHILARLMEECGELAEQVHLFEDIGIKRAKLGQPDRGKLAKEVQDVIRCVLQIVRYYGIEQELDASIAQSYEVLRAQGFLRELPSGGRGRYVRIRTASPVT